MRLVATFAALVLLASCAHAPEARRTYPHAWTQALPPRPVPPVKLQSAQGDYFLDHLHGHWVWLFFGYTNCPDICPNTLGFLAKAYAHLADPSQVRVVFVSVDPRRDTPVRMQELARYFHRDFQGVTGDTAALNVLAGAVGAAYRKDAAPRPDVGYTMSHSNAIFVLDPEGRQVATYQPDAEPAGLAADFDALATR
ncbi:MAG: SCO1/SenC family protein [Cyanobacteria bacterium RYN_339]|nr:SCO1/SenC family protein [Cyanobacteria bacterium RYN_339]